MATKYTVDLTAADLDSIREALVIDANPNFTAEILGDPEASILTVALNEAAIEHLGELEEYQDWCFSESGVCPALYADGMAYPVTIHNA
jgi:hypothetical protein